MARAFTCLITLLIPDYQDRIMSGLIKRGYMVGPGSGNLKVIQTKENAPSALMSLTIIKGLEDTTADLVLQDVSEVCHESKSFYHSMVIFEPSDSSFIGPNFTVNTAGQTFDISDKNSDWN